MNHVGNKILCLLNILLLAGTGLLDRGGDLILLDFAGPFMDRLFLIVVDEHSQWLEVFPLKTATSETTIKALRHLFSPVRVTRTYSD